MDDENPPHRLVYDYFWVHAVENEDPIEFNLPYGEWIRLFRVNGFLVEDLIELTPESNST